MENKLEKIKDILRGWYQDDMEQDVLDDCANELYESIFVEESDLDDIPPIVLEHEAQAEIEESLWLEIYVDIVYLLEDGVTTAKRLYKSFMYDLDIIDTFVRLVNDNEAYIGKEELALAKQRAFATFDREVLALYGIEE